MTELVRYLERLLDPGGLGLLEAVDHIVDEGYLRDHICSVLGDDGSGSSDGVAAYLHPNGFVKIRLAARPGEWSVRLHHWNQSEDELHAHSHRWNFASRLLVGSLRAKTYELSPGDGGYRKYLCRRTDEDGYLLDDRGSCSLSLEAVETYRQGTSYLQEHRFLHAVETATSAPVTVVVQGRDVSDHSLVVTRAEEEPPKQLPVLPLELSQTTPLLNQTLELLQ